MTDKEHRRPLHPISVVADRTGLSADLLRVWERRYGVVAPARDDGGRRLYSDADIDRLRLLGQATNAGRNISQLVELNTDELAELVRTDEAARWRPPRTAAGDSAEPFVDRAYAIVGRMNAVALETELVRAAAVVGAGRFMDAVVAPLFRRIGDAWHAGEVSIAQEHMATAVALTVMSRVRASLPVSEDAPSIVVATPSGERHEIGALLAAGTAALEGWRVTYLGSDLPAADIAAAALDTGARVVALSLVYGGSRTVVAELTTLRKLLPPDVSIVIGGAGLMQLNGGVPGVVTLDDVGDLRTLLAGSS